VRKPPRAPTEPKKVTVSGARGGFLTHGSFLTVNSYPARTSPVIRGSWVLEQLLCTPPPPPPPGVEGLIPEDKPSGTLRQRLEAHRAMPVCAVCHSLMDPIGFGLENFDAIGVHRTLDAGMTIDASGMLPDGRRFNGAKELAAVLAADARYSRCLAEHLYVYALGRGVVHTAGHMDEPTLEGMSRTVATSGYRMRSLIELVATSDPFVRRRGEVESGVKP
jgi:hypothetical protein